MQELAQGSASGHDNRREATSGPSGLFLLQDGAADLRSVVGGALQETSFLAEDKGRWGSGQKTSQTKASCERKALGLALSAQRIRVTSVVRSMADLGSLLGPAAAHCGNVELTAM